MQNIVINMCENFQYDRLRNGSALGNRKSDNNKNPNNNNNNNNNVRSHWGPVSGSKNINFYYCCYYNTMALKQESALYVT